MGRRWCIVLGVWNFFEDGRQCWCDGAKMCCVTRRIAFVAHPILFNFHLKPLGTTHCHSTQTLK